MFIADETIIRAEHLSLINIMSIYFKLYLNFIYILLDVLLFTYQRFHASTNIVSIFLDLFHIVINVVKKLIINIKDSKQIFELIINYYILYKFILS